MNVLVIMGGPRKRANTETALNAFLKGVEEGTDFTYRVVDVCKIKVNPCIGCLQCASSGSCIYRDDMKTLYRDFEWANAIIVASPLYFNSVTAQLKAVIDRCEVYFSRKFALNKPIRDHKIPGVFICVGGVDQPDEEFVGATKVIDLFFKGISAETSRVEIVAGTDKVSVMDSPETQARLRSAGESFSSRLKGV